jgi:trehalose-phosphatase
VNPAPRLIEHPGQIAGLDMAAPAWLFLDYDGTLAGFAPTPDHVLPDPELIELLQTLSSQPNRRVMVISGRRLSHIQKLIPVPGLLLAGSYGLEIQLPDGSLLHRQPYEAVRPQLEQLKPAWQELLAGRENFYLEDKGWSLAIHARFADEEQAARVLEQARPLVEAHCPPSGFRLLGGDRFLEICPELANKGETLAFLLERFRWPRASLLYIGDDDKDEDAFAVIQEYGGQAVVVAATPRPSRAGYRLPSPPAVRRFLSHFAAPASYSPSG